MSLSFATIPGKRLAQGITSASSTFYLNNILGFDGSTDVAPSDLGTQHYCVFRNDTGTVIEIMEIDPATISSGPITIVRRGLSFYGDRTTEDNAKKLDWPANSIVQLGTDAPQIFQYLKEYIDAASIAGAVPASTSAAGIVVEASQAEVNAGTVTKTIASVVYKLFAPLDKLLALFASTTQQGLVEEATQAETTAGTTTGGTGARLYVNPSTLLHPDIQNFETSGTWTKPTAAKTVEVICIGGGGGGGAGDTYDSGNERAGGGGGGGGLIRRIFPASILGTSETVTVATQVNGGVLLGAQGQDGTAGGDSSFGAWLIAKGGAAGYGGVNAGSNAGKGGAGGQGVSSGGAGGNLGATAVAAVGGGGGGGGGSHNNSGGQGGAAYAFGAAGGGGAAQSGYSSGPGGTQWSRATPIAGGLAVTNAVGNNAADCTQYEPIGGAGGSGGVTAASLSYAGSAGGNGGKYGGGGGGGAVGGNFGGAKPGGAGGKGAAGFVQVITYF